MSVTTLRHKWSRLSHLQVGRYAEYFVKMEFTLLGFDVFGAEVDDKGIDVVIRRGVDEFYDVQVKSIRPKKGGGYIFFPKHSFSPRKSLLAAVVLFEENSPAALFLVPSLAWKSSNALLVSRDYENAKSKPEWGINVSGKTRPLLEEFGFERQVELLWGEAKVRARGAR